LTFNKLSSSRSAVALLACVLPLAGCRHTKPPAAVDYSAELPPGTLALKKIPPEQWPLFSLNQTQTAAILHSIDQSLKYMETGTSRQIYAKPYLDIDHTRAVASLKALRETIEIESQTRDLQNDNGVRLNNTLREKFEVYRSVGGYQEGRGYTNEVLFTGYFTPTYDASPIQTDQFTFPLYKRPGDLVTDPVTLETVGRKDHNGQTVPYYTRQEIETTPRLAGQELIWVRDRWDAYVITIQGSARLRLPDGRVYEVGFAGTNGYEYTSPGRQMVADGVIAKGQLSLRGLKQYFAEHPEAMDKYLALNKRFVFFTERPGGPFGSLNVPVTSFATIATDKSVYPRAMPAFVVTQIPTSEGGHGSYTAFLCDQDTGGAIRAAGRTDIYMGVGEQAEKLAGYQLYSGQLYYLAVKPELVSKYATAPAGAR